MTRRIYRLTLYLDTESEGVPPDPELICRTVMASLPVQLADGVRLRDAEANFRGMTLARMASDEPRKGNASRRLLPG